MSGAAVEVPEEVTQEVEKLLGAAGQAGVLLSKDAETAMVGTFASGVQHNGKELPEFIFLYRPDGRRVKCKSNRMLEVIMRKGYTITPPAKEVYDELWFHWLCPVPRCPKRLQTCVIHGEKGADSNHQLMSPDYMILHHLQTGNNIHKQYLALNRKELEKKMSGAFAAMIQQQADEEEKAEKLKADYQRELQETAAQH